MIPLPKSFVFLAVTCLTVWLTAFSTVAAKQPTTREKNLRQEAYYLTILEKTPNNNETRIQLVRLYANKSNCGKAAIHFQKALASGSNAPELYRDMSFCQQQTGNINEAVEICMQGIAANPENAELHLRLGNLYHLQDMPREAEEEYSLYHQLSNDQ